MRVTYRDFCAVFSQEGYTFSEVRHLFTALQSMDRQSRKWFIDWFFNGTLPGEVVEGVTAEYLIDKLKCKPLNAFIILNWLKEDPETAKYFVMKIPFLFDPQENSQQYYVQPDGENDLGEISDE